ncbi:Dimethylaniline monooxygenase N-oxide-forming 5 [Hondaea fermentalgiana]|uniref:Dimethylaniline monooxygenase N-oxide-forming 5 n=1 Tax=Hondaea fermentalgiana TaxID=2315210 RepID=A0A2R5GF17_9STRA|nr:Dimethylaniline monooxygenase N-oxide-forming 5 [Hondaea fermentalgiana]|eukprot:GBG29185.1 Dimethylaniline monooxygenase N-oxide-forming 5 [Hondaea fermentalgiana]
MMRTCVVGAGASGLACAEALSKAGASVKVLEAHSEVGGTWSLSQPDSQLYDGLRTNLPTRLMAFSDFPFPKGLSSFVGSRDMENYLHAFAAAKGLVQYIRFNRQVQHIAIMESGKFQVTHKGEEVETETFDAVVVCNGHFNKRLIPGRLATDAQKWGGHWVHSKDYRRPQDYRDQVVVVVGAQSSGTDIARELDGIASQVHVCDDDCPKEPRATDREGNLVELEMEGPYCYRIPNTQCVRWRPRLESLEHGSRVVHFSRGAPLEADTVIFCTGYQFDYPFLPPGVPELTASAKRVRSVYKDLMHVDYPMLFFVGLNQPIVPFPFFEMQARWVAYMITHRDHVPNLDDRKKGMLSMDARVAAGELPEASAHVLRDQWEYMLDLAREAHLDDYAVLVDRFEEARRIYNHVGNIRPPFPAQDDTYRRSLI